MSTPPLWTVQCGYAAYYAITVTIAASSPEEACERAIEEANGCDGWKSLDHCGPTFVDAIAPGDVEGPWDRRTNESCLPVPEAHGEGGEERIAATRALAFVDKIAACTPSPNRSHRRPRADAECSELLNALINEARALRDRTGLPSPT